MDDSREQARWDRVIAGRPLCAKCNQPITTAQYVEIDDETFYCWDCIRGGIGFTDIDFGEE